MGVSECEKRCSIIPIKNFLLAECDVKRAVSKNINRSSEALSIFNIILVL